MVDLKRRRDGDSPHAKKVKLGSDIQDLVEKFAGLTLDEPKPEEDDAFEIEHSHQIGYFWWPINDDYIEVYRDPDLDHVYFITHDNLEFIAKTIDELMLKAYIKYSPHRVVFSFEKCQ